MTHAYNNFLQEFNATGRERLDGLSFYSLKDLDTQERQHVFQILMAAFKQRDERTPRALAFLEPVDATRHLLAHEINNARHAEPFDLFAVNCAAALVSYVDDSPTLDFLVQVVQQSGDLWTRSTAEEGLERAIPTCNASERLARMVLDAPAGDAFLSWADALLQRHGWFLEDPNTQDETITLLNMLTEGDAAQRRAGLSKVLKAPVVTWPRS